VVQVPGPVHLRPEDLPKASHVLGQQREVVEDPCRVHYASDLMQVLERLVQDLLHIDRVANVACHGLHRARRFGQELPLLLEPCGNLAGPRH